MPDHSVAITRVSIEVELHAIRAMDGTVVSNPIVDMQVRASGEAVGTDVRDQTRLKGLALDGMEMRSASTRGGVNPFDPFVTVEGRLTALNYAALSRVIFDAVDAIAVERGV